MTPPLPAQSAGGILWVQNEKLSPGKAKIDAGYFFAVGAKQSASPLTRSGTGLSPAVGHQRARWDPVHLLQVTVMLPVDHQGPTPSNMSQSDPNPSRRTVWSSTPHPGAFNRCWRRILESTFESHDYKYCGCLFLTGTSSA